MFDLFHTESRNLCFYNLSPNQILFGHTTAVNIIMLFKHDMYENTKAVLHPSLTFPPLPLSCTLMLQVTDYLCDAPLLLQLLARGLSTMGGLVWLFVFRVILCCVGTVVSISSPSLPISPSPANSPETDPSLCGLLGVLDDLVVVILLLICVVNINQQMVPERGGHSANASTSQGVMGNTL